MRRVADDERVLRRKLRAVVRLRPLQRHRPQVIAPRAVVGKGAETEIMPDVEVRQLQLGAAHHVAGQQALHDVAAPVHVLQQLRHAGQQLAGASGAQLHRQQPEVRFQVGLGVRRRVRQADVPQHLGHDPAVGASRPVDLAQVDLAPEALAQRALHGAKPRAVRHDQRPIDIPEQQFRRTHRPTLPPAPAPAQAATPPAAPTLCHVMRDKASAGRGGRRREGNDPFAASLCHVLRDKGRRTGARWGRGGGKGPYAWRGRLA